VATGEAGGEADTALKPHRLIFEQETREAVDELRRPVIGLLASGLVAGMGIGLSLLAAAIVLSHLDGPPHGLLARFLLANAFTIGFIVAIMAHTDVFTEYTTIAIFPVLTGQATLPALARLWALIYVGNMIGVALFAWMLAVLGPELRILDVQRVAELSYRLGADAWWAIALSALLAGWLMGMLSWLITASRDTISQILVIWLITGAIGFAHLHHAISAALEGAFALFAPVGVTAIELARALAWTTLGNAAGGLLFAVMIRYSVLLEDRDSG
jgi:formate-nitrite transporter family protein